MMRTSPLPQSKVAEAERKVSAILADLEETTHSEVKDIALEDVVETDAASGQPAVHQSVDITVQPRAQRQWLTKKRKSPTPLAGLPAGQPAVGRPPWRSCNTRAMRLAYPSSACASSGKPVSRTAWSTASVHAGVPGAACALAMAPSTSSCPQKYTWSACTLACMRCTSAKVCGSARYSQVSAYRKSTGAPWGCHCSASACTSSTLRAADSGSPSSTRQRPNSSSTSPSRSTTVTRSTVGCSAMLAATQPMPRPITTVWPRAWRQASSWLSTSIGDSDIQVSHPPAALWRISTVDPEVTHGPLW